MAPDEVEIVAGGAELLDRVGPLWEQLREHHAAVAPRWAGELLAKQFETRRRELLAKGSGGLVVLLAAVAGRDVGYCVCTKDENAAGEIGSLFVDERYRGRGIGRALVNEALAWFTKEGVRSIAVEVMPGNPAANHFYERLGFAARTVRFVKGTNTNDGDSNQCLRPA